MNDQQYRKTEALLYEYYDNLRQLELLQNKVKALTDDIKIARELYPTEGRYLIASYGKEKTKGNQSIYQAPQDAILERADDYISQLESQRLDMLQRASKIRLAIYDMESALEQLDNFEMQIIECKYRYKMGSTKAAMALNVGSHNTITRNRKQAIHRLAKWMDKLEISS